MIPKILHYCWFGGKELPGSAKEYIKTWKRFCPDYEIVEWNELNFDVSDNLYVKEAYDAKKYAFVSDYARLVALKKYGGIYLDTDVEIKKNLDIFLNEEFVTGFESIDRVGTAVLMAERDNEIINYWLESYTARRFNCGKKNDETTNVTWLTNWMKEQGLLLNGKRQNLKNGMVVYEKEVFFPYSVGDNVSKYDKSYTVHWCEGSWVEGKDKIRISLVKSIKKLIGSDGYEKLRRKFKSLQ